MEIHCTGYIIAHYRVLWLSLSEMLQKLGNAYARTYSTYSLFMITNITIAVSDSILLSFEENRYSQKCCNNNRCTDFCPRSSIRELIFLSKKWVCWWIRFTAWHCCTYSAIVPTKRLWISPVGFKPDYWRLLWLLLMQAQRKK